MRMSKRDKQLLILLVIVALLAGYYWLMYLPQEEKLAELESEKALLEVTRMELDRVISEEPLIDQELKDIEQALFDASKKYYGQMIQEYIIMTINDLSAPTDMLVKSINFSELSSSLNDMLSAQQLTAPDGTIPTSTIDVITATLQYEGEYDAIEAFMYNVYQHPKQLVLQSVNVTSNTEGYISGVMAVEFHGIPAIGLSEVAQQAYFKYRSQREQSSDAFLPYTSFVVPTAQIPDFGGNDTSGTITFEPESPDNPFTPVAPVIPTQLITSFETSDYFFTGNRPEIIGSATSTTQKSHGSKGLAVKYNFVEARDENIANVVFDQSLIMVTNYGTGLRLSAYAPSAFNHKIGAELIDSQGNSYDLTFTQSLRVKEWQAIEAQLPEGISFPFIIRRIYFEGTGIDQQLVADVILDELRLLLPVKGGE
jgi:Tfp pilus assembly protein PilO